MPRTTRRRRGIFDAMNEPVASSILGNILTAQGDLATHDGLEPIRLPIGGTDTFLKETSGDPAWFDLFGGTNVWTAKQDFVATGIELGTIFDTNGVEEIVFTATGSAVNWLGISNSDTGNEVTIETLGDGTDDDIDLDMKTKGIGRIHLDAGSNIRESNWTVTTPVSDPREEGLLINWPAGSVMTVTEETARVGGYGMEGTVVYNTSGTVNTGPVLFAGVETIEPGKNGQVVQNIVTFAANPTIQPAGFTNFLTQHNVTGSYLDSPTFTDAVGGGTFGSNSEWVAFASRINLVTATTDIKIRTGFKYFDHTGSGSLETQTAFNIEALSGGTVANRYLNVLATHPPTNDIDGSIHEPNLWLFGDGITPSFGSAGADGVLAIGDADAAPTSGIVGGVGLWSEGSTLNIRGVDRTADTGRDHLEFHDTTANLGASTMSLLLNADSSATMNNTDADWAMLRNTATFITADSGTSPYLCVDDTIISVFLTTTTGNRVFANNRTYTDVAAQEYSMNQGQAAFDDDPTMAGDQGTTNYTSFRSDGTGTTLTDRATGFKVDQWASTVPTTRRAFWAEDITGSTNAEYLYFEGASGTAEHGSFHEPNLRIGALTTGWGTTGGIGILSLETGTEPAGATPGVANNVMLYSQDISAGNTLLCIRTEGAAVQAAGSGAPENVGNHILIRVNGTTYTLLAA